MYPAAAAMVVGRMPSVSANVTIVISVAETTASGTGSQPARSSGTTTRMIAKSDRASASSDRTPRQPPTSVTATANVPRQQGERRDPVAIGDRDEVLVLALLRDVDDHLIADAVARDLLLAGWTLEVRIQLLARIGAVDDDDPGVGLAGLAARRQQLDRPARGRA